MPPPPSWAAEAFDQERPVGISQEIPCKSSDAVTPPAPGAQPGGMSRNPTPTALTLTALAATAAIAPAAAGAEPCLGADTRAGDANVHELRLATACLVTAERRRRGLAPLRPDGRLEEAARAHARSLVERRYFAHRGPGGGGPSDRVRATGYLRGPHRWMVGETLAWGSRDMATPRSRVRALMDSPPHRAILLHRDFRELGLWVKRGTPRRGRGETGATWVLDFGRVWGRATPEPRAARARWRPR